MRADLPTGTVTFLFTDVEGSTRLLDELGADAYGELLSQHHRVCRVAWVGQGGVEVDTSGDAFFVAFPSVSGALAAAAEAQEALAELGLRVRMGLHTGDVSITDTGYVGLEVHRAARLAAAGHGGQVLLSSSTAALLDPSNSLLHVGLRDLGEHRFKDLAAAERVFQLGDDEFPPIRSLYRSNLPVPATAFLGRERELAEVVSLLREARLVTLTGPGGTGKTRLALQAAAEAADHFSDGVWWVPLAPLRDPGLVLSSVAQVFEIQEEPSRDLAETLAARLGGKRALLLLDNAEHLLPVAAGSVATLRDVGSLSVLVTSRERLQLHGEVEIPVLTLDARDALELMQARAAAVGAQLEPAPAVSELIERLDRLPLAIELAAARLKLFAPEQLLDRIGQRLDLLKGARDADPRQETLRATIEWSYQLLDPEEQRVYRALSVFAGGCTYDAAEEVAGVDPDTLQSLLDKSLSRRRDGESGEPRYWMLETIRQHAIDELDTDGGSDGARGVRLRHARYYAETLLEIQRRVRLVEAEAIATAVEELPNARAGLETAFELSEPDIVGQYLWALFVTWLNLGLNREAVDASTRYLALDEASGGGSRAARFWGRLGASEVFRFSGQSEQSRALKEELIEMLDSGDDLSLPGLAVAPMRAPLLTDLASVQLELGDIEGARVHALRGLEARRGGNAWGVAHALNMVAAIDLADGNLVSARANHLEALSLMESVSSPEAASHELELADIDLRLGDLAGAQRWLSRALTSSLPAVDIVFACFVLRVAAALALAEGDSSRAALWLGAVDAVNQATGMWVGTYELERRREAEQLATTSLGVDRFGLEMAKGGALDVQEALQMVSAWIAELGPKRFHLHAIDERPQAAPVDLD